MDVFAAAAFVLNILYALITVGLRGWIQWRRTGSFGIHGMRPGAPVIEKLAALGFSVGSGVLLLTPLLVAKGVLRIMAEPGSPAFRTAGLAVMIVGGLATFWFQLAMGNSWRIGVKTAERTALVTGGPYAWIRNPIYTAMLMTGVGVALAVPAWLSWVGFCVLLTGLELQVRVVEEPHLRKVHGAVFEEYLAKVGRFLPGVGRVRTSA